MSLESSNYIDATTKGVGDTAAKAGEKPTKSETGETLLAASGTYVLPGNLSYPDGDDKCPKPGSQTAGTGGPNIWGGLQTAGLGGLGGIGYEVMAPPISRIFARREVQNSTSTIDSQTADLLARRQHYLNYAEEQIRNLGEPARIAAARAASTVDAELLGRFAPNDNLSAREREIEIFRHGTTEDILGNDNRTPHFRFLSRAQQARLDTLRDGDYNTLRTNERQAAELRATLQGEKDPAQRAALNTQITAHVNAANNVRTNVQTELLRTREWVEEDIDKFTALRTRIQTLSPEQEKDLRVNVRLRDRLESNTESSRYKVNPDLLELLHSAEHSTVRVGGRLFNIKIDDKLFDSLKQAIETAQGQLGSSSWWRRWLVPDATASVMSRAVKGFKNGFGLFGLGYVGLGLTGLLGGNGSVRNDASQCEADYGDNILGKGSLIPSSITGTSDMDYILTDDKYDFGSQALTALGKAQIEVRSDNMTEPDKQAVQREINTDEATILSTPHTMDGIVGQLAQSPYMIDPAKQKAVSEELRAAVQQATDGATRAKGFRDMAVWSSAYLEAVQQGRITSPGTDVVTTEMNAVRYYLQQSARTDDTNADLTALRVVATSLETKLREKGLLSP